MLNPDIDYGDPVIMQMRGRIFKALLEWAEEDRKAAEQDKVTENNNITPISTYPNVIIVPEKPAGKATEAL